MQKLLVLSLLMVMGIPTSGVQSAEAPLPHLKEPPKDVRAEKHPIKDEKMEKHDDLSAPEADHAWVKPKEAVIKDRWLERRGPLLLEKYDPPQ